MTDRTTINVDKKTHSDTTDVKEEYGDTWPEVLEFYAKYRPRVNELEGDREPHATVEVDGDSIRDTIGEEIEKRLDAITVNVEMDELDLSGSDLSEEDVRTVVRSEIESTVHEKARQI